MIFSGCSFDGPETTTEKWKTPHTQTRPSTPYSSHIQFAQEQTVILASSESPFSIKFNIGGMGSTLEYICP